MRWVWGWLTLALCAASTTVAAQPSSDPEPPGDCAEPDAEAAASERSAPQDPTESSAERERERRLPGPDYLRAGLEQAAMLAGGTIWYWLDDRNIVDWDFESWEQRFSEEAYRFDNNEFPINFIGHPLSGAAYYGLPRANRMDPYTSLLFAVATSFIWEFFLEFQERFSLNDAVATPLGGMAIGEGLTRFARYLDNAAHPVFAWSLGLPVALHELADGRAVGHEGDGAPDEPPGFAHLVFRYGFSWVLPGRDARGPGFDVHRILGSGRFVALDGYLEPGTSVRAFADAEVSEIRMEGLASSTGAGFELYADTIVLGLHARDLQRRPDGLIGSSLILGTNVSHFYRFENYDPWNDRLSYTGFPGLAVDVEEHLGAFHARFSGRINAAFGASTAPGYPRWRATNPVDVLPKSILRKHGYWYGWGWATHLSLELTAHVVAVGGALSHVRLDSQEGFDRLQEEVINDVDGTSELLEVAAWVRVQDLPLGLFLEASWRAQMRSHWLDGIETDRRLDRFELAVGIIPE